MTQGIQISLAAIVLFLVVNVNYVKISWKIVLFLALIFDLAVVTVSLLTLYTELGARHVNFVMLDKQGINSLIDFLNTDTIVNVDQKIVNYRSIFINIIMILKKNWELLFLSSYPRIVPPRCANITKIVGFVSYRLCNQTASTLMLVGMLRKCILATNGLFDV